MNVTIIGAGNMGRGIGTRAVAGGHSVTFVDANPEVAEKTAADVKNAAKKGAKVSTASLGDAVFGDVVVLAVWYGTNIEIAKQLGAKLAGKVVVDIANPLNATYDGLATAPDSSSAEDLAKAVSIPLSLAHSSLAKLLVRNWMSLSQAMTPMQRARFRSWSQMAACAPSIQVR
jgi:predicted dinucleotide-binding enzyme